MMNNPFDLSGRIAVVTGGGRGIGREIVRALANAGAHIAIAEFDPATGADAAAEVQRLGRDALALQVDVRDSASVERMTQQVIERFGHIDILVNNAGIAQHVPSENAKDEDWLNIINVNLNGVFWCCRSVGKRMLERGSGSIVSIASMSGHIANDPQPQTAYNVSKAGVIMLTKSLAAEWAKRGVRVNCVSPGYIGTEMTRAGMANETMARRWLEMTPQGRVGQPIDIANAVWYLASDASPFMTGSDLVVDGGYTAW